MGDRGFTVGMLLGCVLLLVSGLVFSWKEIDEYRHGVVRPAPGRDRQMPAASEPATDRRDGPDDAELE